MDSCRRKTLGRTLPFPKGGDFASFGGTTHIPKRPEVRTSCDFSMDPNISAGTPLQPAR